MSTSNSMVSSQRMSNLMRLLGGDIAYPEAGTITPKGISTEPIGDASDAAIAEDIVNGGMHRDGWKALGSGCYRVVVLSPDGVVYKVQGAHDALSEAYNSNANEVRNYALLAPHLPPRIRLARCYQWSPTVLAMEYVSGSSDEWNRPDDGRELITRLSRISEIHIPRFGQFRAGIADLHGGNYGWENGALVVFDYAQ